MGKGAKDIWPQWPNTAKLAELNLNVRMQDDMARSSLTIGVGSGYWTERLVMAHDHRTRDSAAIRMLCPLNCGGLSPHTLLAIYNLPPAMAGDHQLPLFSRKPQRFMPQNAYEISRPADGPQGSLSVQRMNKDWMALTVRDENMMQDARTSVVSVFFNRMRSPNVYGALVALGEAIKRDNKYFPRMPAP